MSIQLIRQYYANVEKLIRFSGFRNESVLRKAFQELLDHYARSKNLLLVPEVEFITKKNFKVYPDGTLKDALRQDWGFWESKDEKDDLTAEIEAKFAKGYPNFNILFEDTHTAVLYQNGFEVDRASFTDEKALDKLLTTFISYEPIEVIQFHKAIEQFTNDVPGLSNALREIIQEQLSINENFEKSLFDFLELCKKAINPKVEMADVREMIIQHILTEDIFMRVFDEADFHRDNVVAKKLQEVAGTFYKGVTKRNIDTRIAHYYEAINARASQISDHHEKQKFLKALYENFYRSYNPKAADRLGVIYTPEEIVRFMIESTDQLLFDNFGKTLGDPGVDILDPATGTGTFITELIEVIPTIQLDQKYINEIHCNEVAILPYYIANLNIEYTYKQKTGKYLEFENICFVDTLDNMGFDKSGEHQMDFFGMWDENIERISRQNRSRISVVIGNPPYNANQANENENNKNREYPAIDGRIKETYIKHSTAQKTKLYDMYARFFRWASDRLADNGIIAFITNNSYLDSRSFDGFRKVVVDEFSQIYIVDLGGNIRKNPKLSGPKHNVFAIQTGVAIAFFVKTVKKGKTPGQIYYSRRDEFETATDKLEFLRTTTFRELIFNRIQPDKYNNWLNLAENNWGENIQLASKEMKAGKAIGKKQAIFKLYSLGVVTNRDEWVHDESENDLIKKVNYFIEVYNTFSGNLGGKVPRNQIEKLVGESIKWTRAVKNDLAKGIKYQFDHKNIIDTLYRPFNVRKLYFSQDLNEMQYQIPKIFKGLNLVIAISGTSAAKPFSVLATDKVFSLDLIEKTQCLPLYIYSNDGHKTENITDWALEVFIKHYKNRIITKENIFHYVYAVLHHPEYRIKYEINLKHDFPRIPFYSDFWRWVGWGKSLMNLHLNFNSIDPYELTRLDMDPSTIRKAYEPRLIAIKEKGIIEIDTLTILEGVPSIAWGYKIGTHNALEWILERYKEKTPKDPTIREKFNTYKFNDYKEQVINLLMRVCTVSIETMKIINERPTITE